MPYKDPEKRKESGRKRQRIYRENHPDRVGTNHPKWKQWQRKFKLKQRFGVTVEQYAAMLAVQEGVCAICKSPQGARRLHVDHAKNGQVRQLLCVSCNPGLGHFNHDPVRLRVAADLLDQHLLFPFVGMFKRNSTNLRAAADYIEQHVLHQED